jgi:uncharacterized integral membrane protein
VSLDFIFVAVVLWWPVAVAVMAMVVVGPSMVMMMTAAEILCAW